MKSQRQCLHLTCVCGLCHHPSPSNFGNVSGHHLAGRNKSGCWLSFVSFVASFSSVQFCHPCHLSSYSQWLCKLNYVFESIPHLLWAHIDHREFFTYSTKRPPMLCVFTAKRAPSGIRSCAINMKASGRVLSSCILALHVVQSLSRNCLCLYHGI